MAKLSIYALPNLSPNKVWQGDGSSRPAETTPSGGGDMTRAIYDPDLDGVIALAELDPLICSEAEAAALIAAHAAIIDAHHAPGGGGSGATIIVKTADEIVNNSTTLQNDNELFFAIGANEVWWFDLFLHINSPTAADLKVAFVTPSGCSIWWEAASYWNNTSQNNLQTTASRPKYTTGNDRDGLHILALVINGANAGNINFQWAQWAAMASDSKILANSCIIARKVA